VSRSAERRVQDVHERFVATACERDELTTQKNRVTA